MIRRRTLLVVALFTMVIGSTSAQTSKINSLLDMSEFVHDWQISKQFTLDVANAMPSELYSFKPNPEEMTFGEQMIHIALSNAFRFNQITESNHPSNWIFQSLRRRIRRPPSSCWGNHSTMSSRFCRRSHRSN